MINDAFTAGVDLGGLINKNEIKILICYVLNSVNAPLLGKTIIEIFQTKALANYFETSDAISSLESKGHIIKNKENYFEITNTGREISANLERSIPVSVKEKALEAAVSFLTHKKIEKENKVEIIKIENGYNVVCHVSGGDFDLMNFSLYVPDLSQAEMVKTNFHKNPEYIYKLLITAITENKDIAPF